MKKLLLLFLVLLGSSAHATNTAAFNNVDAVADGDLILDWQSAVQKNATALQIRNYVLADVYTKEASDARYSPLAGSSSLTTLGTVTVGAIPWSLITGAPTTWAWSSITSTPTTRAGYGITDADAAGAAAAAQSAAEAASVPTSRTVNGHALTADVTVAVGDLSGIDAEVARVAALAPNGSGGLFLEDGGDGSYLNLSSNSTVTNVSHAYTADSADAYYGQVELSQLDGLDSSNFNPLSWGSNTMNGFVTLGYADGRYAPITGSTSYVQTASLGTGVAAVLTNAPDTASGPVTRAGEDARMLDTILAGTQTVHSLAGVVTGSGGTVVATGDLVRIETGATLGGYAFDNPFNSLTSAAEGTGNHAEFDKPWTIYYTAAWQATTYTNATVVLDVGQLTPLLTPTSKCEGWQYAGGNWTPYSYAGSTLTTGTPVAGTISNGFIYVFKLVNVPGTGLALYFKRLDSAAWTYIGTTLDTGATSLPAFFSAGLINSGTAADEKLYRREAKFVNTGGF